MSLYNRSSLIQVPSLYKDGTLVSTIPEDRSGDFTVARGSNLAATRIGEDGYIKKGYENLLLQSNTFADVDWGKVGLTITGNQQGYDGTNNAWLLESTNTVGSYMPQTVSCNGIQTLSIYAKAGTAGYVYLLQIGSNAKAAYFDLTNGTTGNKVNLPVNSLIEDVGNGWYRCSLIVNDNTSSIRIYVTDSNGPNTSNIGSNIYIQDAQLNQGLVAYPYLETTDSTVYSGLLENSPRVDWSNGVPAVLVEQQRTNLITQSEYFGDSSWFKGNLVVTPNSVVSPEGLQNGTEVNITSGGHFLLDIISVSPSTTYIFSWYAKRGTAASVSYSVLDSTNISNIISPTSYYNDISSTEWTRVSVEFTTPSNCSSVGIYTLRDGGQSGTIYLFGAQVEQASTPSSYIPTYGTSQTRSNEVISDNFDIPTTATIYNSFYSDIAETVFVLDQVFNVAEGLNKVAIAFSPTAVKISVGGSIVANATGTYDTTALSNIQLGSNNGTDYSNAPISGFYVFPEFLTDEELNSLTD